MKKTTALKKAARVIAGFAAVILSAVLAASGYFAYHGYEMYRDALNTLTVEKMAERIRDREDFVSYGELPEFYVSAVISTEDRRFFSHSGIDPAAICRAVLHDIRVMAPEQGGSTITQQLAKNEFFTQEKKAERKFAEIFMAYKIESKLSKEEILELYVNSIYFGSGYYGISEAAEGYFKKSVSELTEYECAMLAGLPNAPSAYSPDTAPRLAKQRTKQVIECMTECGAITEVQAEKIQAN